MTESYTWLGQPDLSHTALCPEAHHMEEGEDRVRDGHGSVGERPLAVSMLRNGVENCGTICRNKREGILREFGVTHVVLGRRLVSRTSQTR